MCQAWSTKFIKIIVRFIQIRKERCRDHERFFANVSKC